MPRRLRLLAGIAGMLGGLLLAQGARAQAVCDPQPPYLGSGGPEICVEVRETPSGAVQSFRGPSPLVVNATGVGPYDVALTLTSFSSNASLGVTANGSVTRSSAGGNGLLVVVHAGLAGPLPAGSMQAVLAGSTDGPALVTAGVAAGYNVGVGDPQFQGAPAIVDLTLFDPQTFRQATPLQPAPAGAIAVGMVLGFAITNVGDTVTIPASAGIGDLAAAPASLELVVDTDTPVPGGTGNFTTLGTPAIHGGDVAFGVTSGPNLGAYKYVDGVLEMVANGSTPIPGGSGSFTSVPHVDIENGKMAFYGFGPAGQWGLYSDLTGSLDVVADFNTAVPGGTGNFFGFSTVPSISQGEIGFEGFGATETGIYKWSSGVLSLLADTHTPLPGGGGNFANFREPDLESGDALFTGGATGVAGLHRLVGGVLETLVDTSTPIPGGIGNFVAMEFLPDFDDGNPVFLGLDSANSYGLYILDDGVLKVVADKQTPIPNGAGNFTNTLGMRLAADDGVVVFTGFGADGQRGIYVHANDELRKLVDVNDSFDGHAFASFALLRNGIDGNRVAFYVSCTDGYRAIFIATLEGVGGGAAVPALSPVSQLVGVLVLLALGTALSRECRRTRAT